MQSRPLDVVVFGATGDTGSAAVRLLYHQAATVGVDKWAPAARNLQKLESEVLQPLMEATAGGSERWAETIQADVADLNSLVQMCLKTKVVIACAGPYENYGENVIVACIKGGCHYVDVTGEVDWVNLMRKRYNNAARAQKVSIVSFCGYDSVPMDMSAWLLADALRKSGDEAKVVELFAATENKGGGGVPTGTINTVLTMVNKVKHKVSFGLLGTAPRPREQVGDVHKGLEVGGDALLSPEVKRAVVRDGSANAYTYKSDLPAEKVWSQPHFMSTINMPVVHATAKQEGFDFEYR
jgi:short subunit dehydrogenase-like uncharacterized protein